MGGRFALHVTGVGLVLLAHAPVEVQEAARGISRALRTARGHPTGAP
ncbi:hypothetical protein ABTZ99_11645 [Actinosynnema sp. NPDC002837]